MRRTTFLVLGAVAAWLVLFAAPALADNGVHVRGAGLTPDSCAGCHRLHTAPAPLLLKQDGTALCYTCHGNGGTGSKLDSQNGVQYDTAAHTGATQALRGGGFSYALIDTARTGLNTTDKVVNAFATLDTSATSTQKVTSTHSVDRSNVVAWGNVPEGAAAPQFGTTIQLRCGSCHDPHGNGYYRILRPKPQQSGISRTSATNGGVGILDVQADASGMKGYTTTNYWNVSMDLATLPAPPFTGTAPAIGPANQPFNGVAASAGPPAVALQSGIAAWCSTCHTRYLAASGSNETNVLNDPIFSYRHTSNREITTALNARNCVQCHVAHGSNAKMGGPNSGSVNNPDNTTDPGGSKLLRVDNRGVCQICHNK